jgi:hypothetical protein
MCNFAQFAVVRTGIILRVRTCTSGLPQTWEKAGRIFTLRPSAEIVRNESSEARICGSDTLPRQHTSAGIYGTEWGLLPWEPLFSQGVGDQFWIMS